MIPDDENALPVSSFQFPIPVPADDPDAGTLLSVQFSADWQFMVIGCLMQLLEQTTWDTNDEATLNLAQARADMLMQLFMEATPVIYPGMIVFYGAASPPAGYLLCDGSAVSRTTYADLFAAIGTTFGAGNGTTTFNLPDLRGRSPIGTGQGSGLTNRALAANGGEESHVLTTSELASHSHTDTGHTHSEGTATATLINGGLEAPASSAIPSIGVTGTGSANLTSAGSDSAHNTMHPFLALTAMIKT